MVAIGVSRPRVVRELLVFAATVLMSGLCATTEAWAQSPTATLSGTVQDETDAVLPDTTVTIVDTATMMQRRVTTNARGSFTVPLLPAGHYSVRVDREGFTPVDIPDTVLNVNDQVTLTIRMTVAAVGDAVSVVADPQRRSTSPAVGTVIDRQFVENLPLNGRTLQSLLQLTPGVVLTRVGSAAQGNLGQFSVNGQRTNANYFTVDGVSANVGINAGFNAHPAHAATGSTPALTVLGTTNGLVSVDALQEFRMQTSTYAPEFGRMPGGQVSMITRSGTNSVTGSVFEAFRHEVLDATDWFTNNRGQSKPRLRQHNFGGVVGGPVLRNRLFYFGSYEGLRLSEPRSRVVAVPSEGTRRSAIAELQPYIGMYPRPNGRDLANGFSEFAATYSDTSRFDSTSVRGDYTTAGRLTLFGRFHHAPSHRDQRAGALTNSEVTDQTDMGVTIGSTWVVSGRVVHDLRANYSRSHATITERPDTFGGAAVPPTSIFGPGLGPENSNFGFVVDGADQWGWGAGSDFRQRQLNVVDTVTLTAGSHDVKFGVDYRRIAPVLGGGDIGFEYLSFSVDGLRQGRAQFYQRFARSQERHAVAFDNLSLFAQDNWRIGSRLTLTYGLRWELVPPPHATEGPEALTLENLDSPYGGEVDFAAPNTPLWDTRYDNFAPRIGASYVISEKRDAQTVVRGGVGRFYDLGFGEVANSYRQYPFSASRVVDAPLFPLTPEDLTPPRLVDDLPQQLWVMDRSLRLPVTYQWNVSLEQSLGPRQSVTVSYVGAEGRRLLKTDRYHIALPEWPDVFPVVVNRNRGYSDYRALQIQFQRRLHQGLQGLVSYTFGRSRDTASSESSVNVPAERLPPEADFGYSDFDVRHNLSAAVTYEIPVARGASLWRAMGRGWGLDVLLRARSSFPINVVTGTLFPPDTETVRPNVVQGEPFWIDDASAPGGRRLNRGAFVTPPPSTQGDLPRGAVRGFNAHQIDLALRREFQVQPGVRLQLRIESFNLLNTTNFLDPVGHLQSGTFGVSTQILGYGFGGLSPLYQMGGPRSTQLSLKFLF